jgi:tRNA A-37 threonylcarbamoyl transferase component Bud32
VIDSILEFHSAGYAHGDLHHNNILVRTAASDPRTRVSITDFDLCGVGRGWPPRMAQLVDLARLAASLYQIVPTRLLAELFSYYLRQYGLSRTQRKVCRATVAAAYQRIMDEYLACFNRMEARCLAQAEKAIASAETPM